MITYKVGDLIEALKTGEVNAIGHQANCFCTMNSGVAKAIKLNFKDAWDADQETEKGDRTKLGDSSVGAHYREDRDVGLIYNLYGQYNYGYDAAGYTDYDSLEKALISMRDDLLSATHIMPEYLKVGFPKIGAGLGGGDWDTIEAIIKSVFADPEWNVTIYILKLEETK